MPDTPARGDGASCSRCIKHELCGSREVASNLGRGRISEWHPEEWRAARGGTGRGRRAFQNHMSGTGQPKPSSSCVKQTPFNPPSGCASLQGKHSMETIATPIRRKQESGGELQAVEHAVCAIGSWVLIQKLETTPHKHLL